MIEIAYLAILSIPVLVIFAVARLSLQLGIALAMICGIMYLPEKPTFDLPLLPQLNRQTLTLLSVTLVAVLMERSRPVRREDDVPGMRRWLPKSPFLKAMFLIALVQPVGTWITNRDTLGAPNFAPGMSIQDLGNMTYQVGFVLLAVAVGRRFMHTPAGTRALVLSLAAAGVLYAGLNVLEWRLAPFLNQTIYGFQDIWWAGIKRWGAVRPQVFQSLGLLNASLMVVSMLAMLVMVRASAAKEKPFWRLLSVAGIVGWICAWSLGGWIVGVICGTLIAFASYRVAIRVIFVLAVAMFAYPFLRIAGVFPTEILAEAARLLDAGRAASLNFRFEEEDLLIAHVSDRPLFGYGQGSRPFIFNQNGEMMTTVDSYFIITYSKFGIVGLISRYGLAFVPLFMLFRYRRRIASDPMLIGLGLLTTAVLMDSYVNATFVLARWFMVGALIGRIEYELARKRATEGVDTAAAPPPVRGGMAAAQRRPAVGGSLAVRREARPSVRMR